MPVNAPAEAPVLPTGHNRVRAAIGIGLVALVIYLAIVVLVLYRSYNRELDFVSRNQQNLAIVLERQAMATVDKIDTVLLASRMRLAAPLPGEPQDAESINNTLRSYLALISESQSLRVANTEGRFIYDAWGYLSSATIDDRDYFHRNRDDPQGGLVISEPLFARITHNWVITLSRRVDDRQGNFSGLVQAAVRADYFRDFYASLDLSAQSVALIDHKRRLVARYPDVPERLGKALDSASLLELLAERKTEGIFTERSVVDGAQRFYAMRKVGSYPLYVVVGRATEDYLSNWHRQVAWSVVSAVVLAVVLVGWIVVWLRIYDKARRLAHGMTEAYETTVRRTRALLNSLPDPAWLADRDQRMIAVNDAYRSASGRSDRGIVGFDVKDIWPAETAAILAAHDAAALAGQYQHRSEGTQLVADGSVRWFEYISTPVLDERGELVGVAGVARDITRIREDEARIRYLAEHDSLTGLPNRTVLNERVSQALAEAVDRCIQVALLFLDLDNFKNINDTLGHAVGDQLLLLVARRLRDSLEESDTVIRQGGDEFTVLLRHSGDLEYVADTARRLIEVMSPHFRVEGHELVSTLSIGIAIYPHDGTDIGTLLKSADTAMYQAKARGGGDYCFFAPEMNARLTERVVMEQSLHTAIERGEFILHYQPQIDATSGRLLGVEALVRWQHPEQGTIEPGLFISLAEETYLINPIGQWVLREACRQVRAWRDAGHPELVVAVNLSAVQFRQPDLVEQVVTALSEAGLDPQCLELELTESVLMREAQRVIEVLVQLRALGVRLSVDDFGTGYSSLSYLKRMPFDKIKIDKSFIRDLPASEDDAAISRAIIGIAKSMDKMLIAEGVETAEQRDFLLRYGCRQMQGYFFSRPVPATDLESRFLRDFPGKRCPLRGQ